MNIMIRELTTLVPFFPLAAALMFAVRGAYVGE
jgi:hypothetical protein